MLVELHFMTLKFVGVNNFAVHGTVSTVPHSALAIVLHHEMYARV